MSLQVFTSRISYRGADRLDVTRKSGGVGGTPFAPSWGLLTKFLRRCAGRSILTAEDFAEYSDAYLGEMRLSYGSASTHAHWRRLLSLDRVVLCCYCVNPLRCHRFILRTKILPALGGVDCGELAK